ncbi:MAG: SDR family oxidoreductase [Bacteroidia bacterium]
MKIDLKGKQALVCGSTKGIGKAIAVQLAASGASVTLVARNESILRGSINDLDTSKGQIHNYLVADFSKPNILEEVINTFILKQKTVHILINNTGGPPPGAVSMADLDEFTDAFKAHLLCNHIMAKALIQGMKAEKYGRIINIISTSVKMPLKGLGVSNTIRGAVANWSKTLATELAPFGITVNNILPGATKTERLTGIISNKAEKANKTEAEAEAEMLHEIPAGRFGTPEELAYAATFLASPWAGYITGTNVVVDGGRTGCL